MLNSVFDHQASEEVRFGQYLRQERTALGMSQRELAQQMVDRGHSAWVQSTVTRTEAGDRPLRLDEFVGLCRVLDQAPAVVLQLLLTPWSEDDAVRASMRAQKRELTRRLEAAQALAAEIKAELAPIEAALHEAEGGAPR